MIIIYGTRFGGTIEGFDGQYGATRFAHVYWIPLFPVGSMWVTGEADGGHFGHAMKLSLKSVVAGYARVWGLIFGVAGIATGGVGYVWGIASLVAAAATLVWWSVRGEAAVREREFLSSTVGTACDPDRMPESLAHELRADVESTWAEHFAERSPNDAARFGAKSAEEAALAYTLLRLVGRTTPAAAAETRTAAARLVAEVRDTSALDDGNPYRTHHDVSGALDD